MKKSHSIQEEAILQKPDLSSIVPERIGVIKNASKDLPRIAKDKKLTDAIEASLRKVPTTHRLYISDSRDMSFIETESLHLVVTSPPYWTLKEYNKLDGQMGMIKDYEEFISELDKVWKHCHRVLVPGGRLVCIVGDVCLSRRKNNGRHAVIPLHASIQEHCRKIGFDNLASIIWHKIANISYEVEGGSSFLGKPYEPNAVIKNDIEFILMERKPGGYRSPSIEARVLSIISEENHRKWFQQIWHGITGASTRNHPAPFPVDLAERLIRMFSFVGDTVLDPFMGSGSTNIASARCGRNSIGVEIDPKYFDMAHKRIEKETHSLFSEVNVFPFK
jgi:DNA modification methylase